MSHESSREQLTLPGFEPPMLVGFIALKRASHWEKGALVEDEEWVPVTTYGGTAKLYTTESRARGAVHNYGREVRILPVYVPVQR